MRFFQKMERKFGKYAVPNLTRYLIATYIVGYLMTYFASNILTYLLLDPAAILQGQVWRLLSWVLIPPTDFSLLTIIMLYFYYCIGNMLERTWGTFRYNVYIFGGMLLTVVGAFVLYGVSCILYGSMWGMVYSYYYSYSFSTYYICLSMFLGFALTYPDMQVLLFFILPIRMKWLAYLDLLYLAYDIYVAVNGGDWGSIVVIVSSLANVLIFFLIVGKQRHSAKRRPTVNRPRPANTAPKIITIHRCAVCGKTEQDGADLEFRYCSKCNGNFEYCQDHLFTHEHRL